MPIQKTHVGWLIGCPASDLNFKNHLAEANLETCEEALLNQTLTKTARAAIEGRRNKLHKTLPHPAAHRKAGASATDLALANKSAPGTLTIIDAEEGDAIRAEQLTTQWKRAIQGEAEQHIFGAMMILLTQHLKSVSTLGHAKLGNEARKGTGVDGWLQEHAPTIKRPTAYRWMQAAKGLVQKTGIAGAEELQALLGTAADDLPEPQRAQQMELFSVLEKHSQSDLINFAPKHRLGGKTYERDGVKGKRKELPADYEMTMAVGLWKPTLRFLAEDGLHEKSWAHLPDAMLRELKGLLIDLNKLVPAK